MPTVNKKKFVKPTSANLKVFERKASTFRKKKAANVDFRFKDKKRTSFTGFEEKVFKIKKISKTTKRGRNMRFSALAIVGDLKGNVGFGIGKSIEVPVAIRKALKKAKNNMFQIKMTKNLTLYHEVIGKHGASKVLIKPAKKGTGIIAGGVVKTILELLGFKDVYSKNLGCNTALNMAHATIKGLLSQKTPKEFAFLRDKKVSEL